MQTPDLERIAAVLQKQGLRPMIDSELEVVLCDHECGLQDSDPAGLYRPCRWVPRSRDITVLCACGYRKVRPREAQVLR